MPLFLFRCPDALIIENTELIYDMAGKLPDISLTYHTFVLSHPETSQASGDICLY